MVTRNRILVLALIMIGVAMIAVGVTLGILYDNALKEEHDHLVGLVQSQAHLIEAIARFEETHSQEDNPAVAHAATLAQVQAALEAYPGFETTGEFVVATLEGDKIHFLLRQRERNVDAPMYVPIEGDLAEPMRRALRGESGFLIGLDYEGTRVMAAYVPVDVLKMGLVAKTDLTEIYEPFVRTAGLTFAVAVLIIALGVSLFIRISNPLVRQLEQSHELLEQRVTQRTAELHKTLATLQASEERFRNLLESLPEALVVVDRDGIIQQVNIPTEELFGAGRQDLVGKPVETLLPESLRRSHLAHMEKYRAAPKRRSMGADRALTARRVNGETFPIEISLSPLETEAGLLVIASVHDISARHRLEQENREQLKSLKGLWAAARQLSYTLHSETLNRSIARMCVEEFGAQLAWLGLKEPGGRVRRGAHFPEENAYPEHITVRWDDAPEGSGPAGQAIRTGVPVVMQDIEDEESFSPWQEEGRAAGFVTSAAFPLLSSGETFGALNVYSDRPGFFDEKRVEFFQTYAHQAATALENARLWETTRQRAEHLDRLVAERTAELDRFFSLSLDLLCIAGKDGYFKRLNPAWEQTLGFTPEELMARPIMEFVHPDDREATLALEGRKTIAFENRYASKDGGWRRLQWNAAMLPEGESIYAVARDVTDSRRVERDLSRLAAIVAHADAAIISKSLDGIIQSWNPAAERVYGYQAEEMIGQHISLIVPPDRLAELEAIHARIQRGERTEQLETVRICKDGDHIPISLTLSPTQNADGEINAIATIEIDLRERIHREEELRRAKAAAEAANRTKSEFLASMSHELRTPLNAIIGFSELLQGQSSGALNPKQSRYVANVLSSGQHLLQLINDILDLSKVEAGRMELDLAPCEVAPTIAGVLAVVEPLAQKKQIELRSEIPPDLPPLTADSARFKQILYNLLSNAIKFTPEGGEVSIQLSMAGGQVAAGADQVPISADNCLLIRVKDSGIGIKAGDLERLFETFERAESGYAGRQEGTGLGLALTRRLVALHGGHIWAESEGPGHGSTFSVRLPISPPAMPAEADWAGPQSQQGSGPLVLIVEDECVAAELLAKYLLDAGYSTVYAQNRTQALEMAHQLKPHAITLDILLPDAENGFGVLKDLEAEPQTAGIPVIVVSVTDDVRNGFALGVVRWLVKPVDRQALVQAIEEALERVP